MLIVCYNAFGVSALAARRRVRRLTDPERWNDFVNMSIHRSLGEDMTAAFAMFVVVNNKCKTDEDVAMAEGILQGLFSQLKSVRGGIERTYTLKKRNGEWSIEVALKKLPAPGIDSAA